MYSGTAAKVIDALRSYDLKEEGDGKYRSNSPLRPGSNSHGFTLTVTGDEHGAYFDHVSHESGSLYDLAKMLSITPDIAPVENTKRAYAGIDDYAAAHGVVAEVLRSSGWYETIYQGRPALAFQTKTGLRWRFLDGKNPHYISPKGYTASWYGLTASAARKLADGQPLVLANGEISTVAARHHGLVAACVTGGEKGLSPALIQELRAFLGDDPSPIIVAFDCDETGQRAGRLVTRQLRDVGFIARLVDLKLGKGGDLADFCMLHGTEASKQLNQLPAQPLEEVVTPIQRGWYIIPADELRNLPPIEWIVDGEIPARSITVLFGPSGAGKSFLALDYALSIAQDKPVVYMAGEGEYGYRQRVAAWTQHNKQNEANLFMCIGAVQFMETDDLDAFLHAVDSINPEIVIVDTMARSMVGSDENSTRDMGLFIQACENIKNSLDCAVLIIHHTNKGGVTERGNSALRGASDAMIKVVAVDDLIRVECAKTKDAKPFQSRYMQLIPVTVSINGVDVESAVIIEADRVEQTADDPLTQHQEAVLRLLAAEEHGATRKDIADATGIPYNSLQRVISRLSKLEMVESAGYGQPYKATQTGLDRLDRLDRALQPENGSGDQNAGDQPDQPDQLGEKLIDLIASDGADQPVDRADEGDQPVPGPDQGDQPAINSKLFDDSGDDYYKAGL